MATSDLLIREQNGTPKQLNFYRAASFTGAGMDLRDATSGNRVAAELDLTSLANSNDTTTGFRQSAKIDLGALWARSYRGRVVFEFAATPVAGQTVELWWGESLSGTAGTGNPANLTGSDAAYSGYSSNGGASIVQLARIGFVIVTAQATTTLQVAIVQGLLRPTMRYGILVVYNRSGAAFHSAVVNTHLVFDPIVPQGQAT